MTGKELVFKTYRHEETPRPPWVPFAGIHAGIFKNYTATEMLKDSDKLLASCLEVHKYYMPDGQPVAFDLQLEAEVLGCELMWANDNPPSVKTHPLADTDEIPTFFVEKDKGRIPVVMDASRKLVEAVGDTTAIYGLFCGPFTLASHLRGTKLFRAMRKNPQYVHDLIRYCTENALRMIDYYVEAGVHVIAPVDPVVSQIAPESFQEFLHEAYTQIFDYIRGKGCFSALFVCGDARKVLDVMCKTGPDAVSIDENIPMPIAKEITDRYNISIGGNIPLTTTMLFGNQQDNMKYVVDMIDSVNKKNLVVSPGCDMPYATPKENAIAVAELLQDVDKYREVLKNYESTADDVPVDLPDYKSLQKPLIEAFTLDSASCAACTYMWAMAQTAKAEFGDKIDVVEHKYTTREGIAQAKAMGVANLPSLYINGTLKYASLIPGQEEFFKEIESVL